MYGKELAAKIEAECRYTGPNRADGYVYSRAISEAINVVLRELPVAPEPVVEETPKRFSKKKVSDTED